MEIVDDDQYKALSFVAFANRGGSRPTEVQLCEWMAAPRPKPAQRGKIIKPGRDAVYETTWNPAIASGVTQMLAGLNVLSNSIPDYSKLLSGLGIAAGSIASRKLVRPAVPAEYGPDIPEEAFVAHLVRLQWIEVDERGGLAVTPLGRALMRSVSVDDDESNLLDVVVLDADNELSYPIFIKSLAEAGEALLIDPYLRIEQLLSVRAHTTVSRVLISARVKQEDRAGMAVLVESGGAHDLEIRVADAGVLHDRLIVSDDEVLTIGTSINTIGRQHPTVLTPLPEVAADAYRAHAEKWWEEAEFLAAYPPCEADEVDEEDDQATD